MRFACSLPFLLSVLGSTSSASAQSPPQQIAPVMTNEERDRLAREHFQTGRTAFTNGDFETAAREFQEAYNLSERSALLFNIGTAHERLHDWPEAQRAFQRYLTENPNSPDRLEVEARLRAIDAEVNRSHATTRVVVVERPIVVEDSVSRPFRVLFFVSAGLTVIAGGATLAVGLLAQGRYNALSVGTMSCAPTCPQRDIDDLTLRENIVNGGIATTAVFAAATIAFYVADALRARPVHTVPATPAPSPQLGFLPTAGGGMLTLGGAL